MTNLISVPIGYFDDFLHSSSESSTSQTSFISLYLSDVEVFLSLNSFSSSEISSFSGSD
jgi:hypothetical protein